MRDRDRRLRRFLRLPGWSAPRISRDVDDELRFHLEMRAGELRAQGLSPEAAHQEALRRFGDLTDATEYCRMMDDETARRERRQDWIADLWYDFRWSLRQMRRHPAFTLLAVVTLAIGIGASTAIYSVVHRLLIQPMAIPNGDRVAVLVRRSPTSPLRVSPSVDLVQAWRGGVRAFEWIAAFNFAEVMIGASGDTATVERGAFETALPRLIAARPALGRFFAEDEGEPGAPPVAMLGYGHWQQRYGGDRDVVGRTVTIDGQPHTIVGVASRDFALPFFGSAPRAKDIWVPLVPDTTQGVNAMAMLRPGATAEQASREMTAIMADIGDGDGFNRQLVAAALRPQDFLGKATRDTLVVTMVAVAVLLLIASTNVANLLLARSIGRARELAVRSAVGAGRGRLVRQLLAESALLSFLGGALGLLVAWRGLAGIVALRPDGLMALDRVRLDAGLLAGALGVAVLTGLVFGLAPAIFATEGGIGRALRQGAAGTGGHRHSTRLRSAFVTVEIALSVILLVGAGLLMRSFLWLQRVDTGIDPRGLMSVDISLPDERYPTRERRQGAFDEIVRRVGALPGIRGADVAAGLPTVAGIAFGKLEIEGASPPDAASAASVFGYNAVRPGFFRLIALRLREGRMFSEDSSAHEAIINATMAARYWPGLSAVGRRFRLSDEGSWSTIAGVVDDVRLPGARGSSADHQLYYPYRASDGAAALVFRADEAATNTLQSITTMIGAIDPAITVSRLMTMRGLIEERYVQPRFAMALLAAFAVIALLVASVGLYGVIAFAVSRRMREMGIRLALGALPRSVVRLVLAEGARLGVVGIAIGLAGAAMGTRLMQALIHGISPLDPFTFAAVGITLLLVSLLASYAPARRAVRVDPLVALRSD